MLEKDERVGRTRIGFSSPIVLVVKLSPTSYFSQEVKHCQAILYNLASHVIKQPVMSACQSQAHSVWHIQKVYRKKYKIFPEHFDILRAWHLIKPPVMSSRNVEYCVTLT